MNGKRLGRTGLILSPFGARLGTGQASTTGPPPQLFNWVDVPTELTRQQWLNACKKPPEPPDASSPYVLARVGPAHWDRSMSQECDALLACIGRRRIEILQLAVFDLERIKAGEPFRRMLALRDAGKAKSLGVQVASFKEARWVIEQTPAHVISIDARLSDEEWSDLFALAREADAGLIAGPAAAGGDRDAALRMLANTPIAAFSWPGK